MFGAVGEHRGVCGQRSRHQVDGVGGVAGEHDGVVVTSPDKGVHGLPGAFVGGGGQLRLVAGSSVHAGVPRQQRFDRLADRAEAGSAGRVVEIDVRRHPPVTNGTSTSAPTRARFADPRNRAGTAASQLTVHRHFAAGVVAGVCAGTAVERVAGRGLRRRSRLRVRSVRRAPRGKVRGRRLPVPTMVISWPEYGGSGPIGSRPARRRTRARLDGLGSGTHAGVCVN